MITTLVVSSQPVSFNSYGNTSSALPNTSNEYTIGLFITIKLSENKDIWGERGLKTLSTLIIAGESQ